MQSIDCVSKLSMTSKCTYVLNGVAKILAKLLKYADSSELSGCSHIVDCMSMSSKCNYILNGSGESAQVRRLVWAFCHAIKTAVDCVSYLCFD